MLPVLSTTSLRTTTKDGYDYSKQIKNACQKNRQEHQLLTKQLKGMKRITDENISTTNFTIRKLTLSKSLSSPPCLTSTISSKPFFNRDSLSVPSYQRQRSSTLKTGKESHTAISRPSNITHGNRQYSRKDTVKLRSSTTSSHTKPMTSAASHLLYYEEKQEGRLRSTSLPPLRQAATKSKTT